jgi:hypothetical protein
MLFAVRLHIQPGALVDIRPSWVRLNVNVFNGPEKAVNAGELTTQHFPIRSM